MTKYEGVLHLLMNVSRDGLVAKNLGIMHLHDLSVHVSSEEDINLMIKAVDGFNKSYHRPACSHAIAFRRHERALLGVSHVRYEQSEKQFSTFVLFLETRIQQNKSNYHLYYHRVHQYYAPI